MTAEADFWPSYGHTKKRGREESAKRMRERGVFTMRTCTHRDIHNKNDWKAKTATAKSIPECKDPLVPYTLSPLLKGALQPVLYAADTQDG